VESWRMATHLLLVMLTAVTGVAQESTGHSPSQQTARTRVVLLGTGTPVPDPDRSGPATVIVVDDCAYLVDFGPGVVRRAESAALTRGIPAVEPGNLKVAFVTHLHSDHTAGYSDLILTGWTSGRKVPLEVYGPSGLQSMTEHILQPIESTSRHALIPTDRCMTLVASLKHGKCTPTK
jgi:ribonuclease BN (tRNA processing enzyme)